MSGIYLKRKWALYRWIKEKVFILILYGNLRRFLQLAWRGDEFFFLTMVLNSPCRETIVKTTCSFWTKKGYFSDWSRATLGWHIC